jgi:hypothetical protein
MIWFGFGGGGDISGLCLVVVETNLFCVVLFLGVFPELRSYVMCVLFFGSGDIGRFRSSSGIFGVVRYTVPARIWVLEVVVLFQRRY